jgi:hypothetical protein
MHSRVVAAQPSGEDADTSMARARFKEGVGFFDKGDFEKARASFKQAYALKKHPSVLLNLAWSCVKGSHVLEGEKYFQQILADGGKDLTDKQRADAADGLAQARAKLGRIEVSAPAGTEVTLDGDHAGSAPVEPLWVEPGPHTVKLKSGDTTPQTMSLSVVAGDKAVARFVKAGAAATATAAGTGAPAEATSASPPPAPEEAPKAAEDALPSKAPAPEEHERPAQGGGSAVPNNLVPVFVLGGVAVAGFVGAGVSLYLKGQAQNSADQVATLIMQHGGGRGACVNPPSNFQAACNEFQTDNNDVNEDATAGNVMLGVGVAAVVGGLAYWLLADKKHPSSVALSGGVTPAFRGLVLSGEF